MAMGAGCYLVSVKNRESQVAIMGRSDNGLSQVIDFLV